MAEREGGSEFLKVKEKKIKRSTREGENARVCVGST